jgi:hypothetical protein
MAVWTSARFRNLEGSIEASVCTGSGRWQAPVTISSGESALPSVALSSTGDAIAAWVSYEGSTATDRGPVTTRSIQSAEYEAAP